jgi:3'(2'), 5'-bisphosphate nucleotidase
MTKDNWFTSCKEIGEKVIQIQQRGFEVTRKEDNSPVTEADVAVHKYLIELLPKVEDLPIISEEDIPENIQELNSYWLIDPLDGTKEFVSGGTEYTINIAKIIKGEIVEGVVYVPMTETMYYAAKNSGSWKRIGEGEWEQIHANENFRQLTAVASRFHKDPKELEYMQKFDVTSLEQRGSSLKICAIAEGTADLYVRVVPTNIWDIAAAQIVLAEAGGIIWEVDEDTPLLISTKKIKNPPIICFNTGLAQKVSSSGLHSLWQAWG